MNSTEWFTADRDGLEAITRRAIDARGVGVIIAELYQNSLDACSTLIDFRVAYHGKTVSIICEDNGDGFVDLSHAWRMFAPSIKKDDPTKAGRFNVGEKFVISIAREATIETTCGTVTFDGNGRFNYPRRKRASGTRVEVALKLPATAAPELVQHLDAMIVPAGVTLRVNGVEVPHRQPLKQFEATLRTEVGPELRTTRRKTIVEVHAAKDGVGRLYELGIPVVETGDKYDVNVLQKVPLNIERDNVTPSFLRALRSLVLNEMHDDLTPDDCTSTWVQDAVTVPTTHDDATRAVIVKQFGENAVAANPFDAEANAKAVAHGATLIPSHAISSQFRAILKDRGQIQSSSEVYGKKTYVDATRIETLDDRMRAMRDVTRWIARATIGKALEVVFLESPASTTVADYNRTACRIRFNMSHAAQPTIFVDFVDLVIHELAHDFESNHLSVGYYDALSKIGARLALAVMHKTQDFQSLANEFFRATGTNNTKGKTC